MNCKKRNSVQVTLFLVIAVFGILIPTTITWAKVLTVVSPHDPLPMVVFSAEEEEYYGDKVKAHQDAGIDLCDFLSRVTGRDITPGNDISGARVIIHVGPDDFVLQHMPEIKDLYADGFVMKHLTVNDRHHIILGGVRSLSSRWAVEEFLKQFAGVRWLFPDAPHRETDPHKYGMIVPSRPTITVPYGLDQKHEPHYVARANCMMHYYAKGGTYLRLRPSESWGFGSHEFENIFTQENYENNPEWFALFTIPERRVNNIASGSIAASEAVKDALSQGVRRQRWRWDYSSDWQICTSSPGTVRRAVKYARDYFAKHPEAPVVSMGHNDNGGWCECDLCQKFIASADPPHTVSEQYWSWVNQVAKEVARIYPDKKVATLAYGAPATPPRFALEKNISVTVTVYRNGHVPLVKQWKEKCDSVNLYSYPYGSEFVGFRHYPRAMRDFLKWGHDDLGAISHSTEVYGNWSFDGPKYHYIQALQWDVNADVDKIMQDYCNDWFGAAAGPMQKFWDRLEEVYERRGHPRRILFYQWLGWQEKHDEFDHYTLDDVASLDAAIAQAEQEVGTDGDRYRVARVADAWKYYRTFLLGKLNYADKKDMVLAEAAQSFDRALKLARELVELRKQRLWFMDQLREYPNINIRMHINRQYTGTRQYAGTFQYVHLFSDMRTILDQLCEQITGHLVTAGGKDEAIAFWQQVKADDTLYESAPTQVYLLQHSDRQNVLANSGFETGDLSGWEVTGEMHTGKDTARAGKYAAQGKGTLSQTIAVKPGERYRLTAWGRYPTVPEPGAMLFSTDISFRGGGKSVSAEPYYRRLQEAGTAGSWAGLKTTLTVPPDAETVTAFLRSRQIPVCWDDITLEKICAVPVKADQASTAAEPRRVKALPVSPRPVIDGILSETCWQQVPSLSDFSVYSSPDVLHPEQTKGWVCFDEDYLYIALASEVENMDKLEYWLAKAAGQFIYNKGNVTELFFDTNRNRKTFQQYLLHSNGSKLTGLFPGDELKVLNDDYLECAVSFTDNGYHMEMAFPLAMLHLGPDTARIWGFNMNRVHNPFYESRAFSGHHNEWFSSWNSTRGKSFLTPELFGELEIEADFSRYYWDFKFVSVPQPGDREIKLQIGNDTGSSFTGEIQLEITRSGDKTFVYRQPVQINAGNKAVANFRHAVSGEDVESRYEITLRDKTGSLVFLGGTQKENLTPRDHWEAPNPTAAQRQSGYIVYHRPYIQPVLHRSVPRQEEIVEELSATGCPGEYVPVTFCIYTLTDTQDVSVSISDLAGSADDVIVSDEIESRYVTYQSDWKNPRSFRFQEHLLRRLKSMNLDGGRSQRFWLTVKIPARQAPGTYSGIVTISSGRGNTQLPLHLTVLPFNLANVEDVGYFMYYRGVMSKAHSTPEFFDKIVKDMREHGMNTFTIYNNAEIFDEETGESRVEVDEYSADNYVFLNYGVSYAHMMDTLLAYGFARKVPLIEVYAGMSFTEDAVRQLNDIYKERHWPEVLYYVNDEIDTPERIAEAKGRLEKLQGYDLRFTTALGRAGVDALGHIYDVWIGPTHSDMIIDSVARGKETWTYSCRPQYDFIPAYTRYLFGNLAWKSGLKGVGLWSYTDDDSFFDRFGRRYAYGQFTFTPEFKYVHGHVYFEGDEIIPLVSWEAVREGIDDYRYMRTLQEFAWAAAASGDEKLRSAGKDGLRLLEEIADAVDPAPVHDELGTGNRGTPYLKDWRYMGDMDRERARVVEATLNILKANTVHDDN